MRRPICPSNLFVLIILCSVAAADDSSCETDGAALTLSSFAHTSNTAFIEKVSQKRAREFSPAVPPAVIDSNGRLQLIETATDKFLSYVSDNGWNNQVLNLLSALDMARLLNRTLIVPPFQWPRRRGTAQVSVGRLVDLRRLAAFGVRVVCEDEQGSVNAALGTTTSVHRIAGEGQPHRKQKMPRWSRTQWVADHGKSAAGLLHVSCCLFWTWSLPPSIARELYASFAYHPSLIDAAMEAAKPLGDDYAAMHVRRGDKASVDIAYTSVFGGRMDHDYFLRLARQQSSDEEDDDSSIADGSTVFVATDELDRSWFAPLAKGGQYALKFVDDLDQAPLVTALSAFPQGLWADVLAILEQIVCIEARGGFVGSLPSTLSGHVVNARAVRGAGEGEAEPLRPPLLFTKLHESCCDARTRRDWIVAGWTEKGEPLPCVGHEEWC